MFLIIGLGNPGEKYEKTRHNVGFMILDTFAKDNNFPAFRFDKKSNSLTSDSIMKNEKIILAKPQTFMNNSGQSVKTLYSKFKILNSNLIIVHDDIDLLLGKIKISVGSSSAGHKGIDSIINSLGTKDFTRIRIGIQPERGKPNDVENFVLKKFTKEESKILEEVMENSSQALHTILTEGIEKARNEINKKAEKESPSCFSTRIRGDTSL